jgi:hypothetical protein
MGIASSALRSSTRRTTSPAPPAIRFDHLPPAILALAGALAVSGLAEVLLQRVVYRIGVHVPRDGSLLSAYQAATALGEVAFRFTTILLLIAALLLAFHFLRRSSEPLLGVALVAALLANALVWPLGVANAGLAAAVVVLAAAAWLTGRALQMPGEFVFKAGVVAAGVTVALGQYRIALTHLELQSHQLAATQWLLEASLLVTAGLLALAAVGSGGIQRRPVLLAAPLVLVLVAAYAREPSTVAILALWSSGVTMSLPPVLYIAAFAAAAYASAAWLRSRDTRHLGLAIVLLFVAGLQPQVVHHGITALMGLLLLTLGVTVGAASGEDAGSGRGSEVEIDGK